MGQPEVPCPHRQNFGRPRKRNLGPRPSRALEAAAEVRGGNEIHVMYNDIN